MLFAMVLSLDGHHLVCDQLAVAGEGLSEGYFTGKGHDRDLILRLQVAEGLDRRGADLIVKRVNTAGAIYEQNDREWEPLLIEIRHGLLYPVLKDREITLGQTA